MDYLCRYANRKAPVPALSSGACAHVVPGEFPATAEAVEQATDIPALLEQIPECEVLITTGQKATDVIVETFGCEEPPMGESVKLVMRGPDRASRTLQFWRMPSTSRAYPLALDRKADSYRRLFL